MTAAVRFFVSGFVGGVAQLMLLCLLAPLVLFVTSVHRVVSFVLGLLRGRRRSPSASLPSAVLITGASSGIGAALAEHYASRKNGVFLALSGRNEERLKATAQRCEAFGAVVETKVIDVLDREGMAEWIVEMDRAHPLDLVVANAGVATPVLEKGQSEEENNRQIVDTNIVGMLNTVYPALAPMVLREAGQVALLGSVLSHLSVDGSSYAASKAFVSSFADALRLRHARSNIRVSVIEPGAVESRITDAVAENQGKRLMLEISAPEAAEIIADGLRDDTPVVNFPFITHTMCYLLGALPGNVRNELWKLASLIKRGGSDKKKE